MELSAIQIAALLGGTIVGNQNVTVNNYSKIEEGKPGTLSFLANPKYESYIYETDASIVLVNDDFKPAKPIKATLVKVPNAYLALAKLLQYAEKHKEHKKGIHKTAKIERSAKIGKNVYIGAFVYIGENVVIGDDTQIFSHSSINDNVKIGENSIIYNSVVVYHDCVIGNKCIIHANTVIGADGFGFAKNPDGSYFKMPQNGNVILEDDVEIGAGTTIDRGSMGPTILRKGVKIDNQVQIAHNVEIGENSAMAACSGIAGSTKVGKDCIIAGMVGISGHIQIADNTTIGAFSGVSKSITQPGQIYQGAVAIPIMKNKRSFAVYRNLPDLSKTVFELEKQIKELKEALNK